ncbi:P63C domain-containing protein [Microvirga arsenatis]|uniref:Bacteriophage Mx8 p63 C-terminal domain-containing protein n=1 Tax=Microvirga arsenatis TaxID=2692265 RepID=A0ABW9YZ54_9HYPH|nr:P63C domain-containing protein [Microvirga arsenatis]NBJ13342.1 hypothetical protein [Microvirga arsenatis]NBJ24126.1 hypothetical protein [Microvirga arsenatis]
MTDRKMPPAQAENKSRPRVAYFGASKLGMECAVLDDGRSGYIQRSLQTAVGMNRKLPVRAFEDFCAKFAPKALEFLEKSGSRFEEVVMPHGGSAVWVEAGFLTKLAGGIIDSALRGRLKANQKHMIAPCQALIEALGEVGEVALIHEATGYQYHRAPDALQDLFSKLIRETAADWERRFHPEYYSALCKLWGFKYGNKHRALPPVIGKVTMDWVYGVVFPPEIIAEVKSRAKSEKLHQWLTEEGGLKLLEKQRDAVMMIARSSVDYKDFEARCSVAFYRPGQQVLMNFPQAEAA